MKKLSKIDVFLFVCLIIGAMLAFIMWIVESITGSEVLLLRIPASIMVWISVMPMAACYAGNIAIQIVEHFKEKKNNRK